MNKSYDAIIIGTGQSGPFLAIRLARAGQKVAIIERYMFGGTCVNTRCIPTKTLVASARVAYMARRAMEFGVNTGAVSVDMKLVKARKDEIRNLRKKARRVVFASNPTAMYIRARRALRRRTSLLLVTTGSPLTRSSSTLARALLFL
jgi:pyruvate/2-oxoglutarate dehydrogenase complex dihydrolipoamide dehydrogenase (E3) component